MGERKKIGVIFGGRSTEHEISVRSTRNVYKNLDKNLFDPVMIYISKKGSWHLISVSNYEAENYQTTFENSLSLSFDENGYSLLLNIENKKIFPDAVFPVLHGPNGEDGTIQGLFKLAQIPFVGPGVLASSLAMDKIIAKKVFIEEGIPTADYVNFTKADFTKKHIQEVAEKLNFPVVVKPSRAGSSVGISKAKNKEELQKAIEYALKFDNKILVEKFIKGREIEVAVLGNENPIASVPGEIVTEFYDYKEKYSDDSEARLDAPADLNPEIIPEIQQLAIKAFKSLDCEGMSRVDFFLTENGLLINEINTIPGFTNISMYPKLFEVSGIPQKELITKLIEAAFDRFETQKQIEHSFESL